MKQSWVNFICDNTRDLDSNERSILCILPRISVDRNELATGSFVVSIAIAYGRPITTVMRVLQSLEKKRYITVNGVLGHPKSIVFRKDIAEILKKESMTKIACRPYHLGRGHSRFKTKGIDEKRYGGNGLKAMKRADFRCEICGIDAGLEIHHNNGISSALDDLVVLCRACHKLAHNNLNRGTIIIPNRLHMNQS